MHPPSQQNAKPPPRGKTASGNVLAVWLGLALLPSCSKQAAPPAPPPPPVVVVEIQPVDIPITGVVIGQLDSPQNVDVRARVEGIIKQIHFSEGCEVAKDEVLFSIDEQPFLERLSAANGQLAEAEAALQKYIKDVERLEPLAKARAIPQQDLDNALAAVDIGRAGVQTAKARVEAAQLDLGYCAIKAPTDGLIGSKKASVGDLVGRGEPTLLATISTLDPIWFIGNVSEVDYLRIEAHAAKTGKTIRDATLQLKLANNSIHPHPGRFVFLDRAVNVRTGTLSFRVEFPNPDKILRPGMFTRLGIALGARENQIVVPERALVTLQGRSFVWTVGPDNTATQIPITTGPSTPLGIEVTGGLQPGTRVIVDGIQKVRQGMPVTPTNPAAPAAPAH